MPKTYRTNRRTRKVHPISTPVSPDDIQVVGTSTGRGFLGGSGLASYKVDLILRDGRIMTVMTNALNENEAKELVHAKFPLTRVKSVKRQRGIAKKVWSVVRPPTASELSELGRAMGSKKRR